MYSDRKHQIPRHPVDRINMKPSLLIYSDIKFDGRSAHMKQVKNLGQSNRPTEIF
jgi:hypothetical protein